MILHPGTPHFFFTSIDMKLGQLNLASHVSNVNIRNLTRPSDSRIGLAKGHPKSLNLTILFMNFVL